MSPAGRKRRTQRGRNDDPGAPIDRSADDKSDVFARVESALEEALSKQGEERAEFVGSLSRTDPEVAQELEALLPHAPTGRTWFRTASEWLRPNRPSAAPTEDIDPLVGTSFHQYEIRGTLGRGGMGVVYAAHDRRLNRPVALKFLRPGGGADGEAKERLLNEARAAAALDHPNICTVYEVGATDDGRLFIAMAHYEGRTLKAVLAEDGLLDPGAAADVALQVARALSVAHHAGIVHRDVKPANVVVTSQGGVKLLDFGVAVTEAGGRRGDARPAGTLAYMSPEQLAGEPVDHRADLWALGVALWEMLSGSHPFQGDSTVELIDAIDLDSPELRAESDQGEHDRTGSDPLVHLAYGLLAKQVTDRPATADEVVDRLVDYVSVSAGDRRLRQGHSRDRPATLPDVESPAATHLGDPVTTSDTGLQRGRFVRRVGSALLAGGALWAAGNALLQPLGPPPMSAPLGAWTFNIPTIGARSGTWSWIEVSEDGQSVVSVGGRGEPLSLTSLDDSTRRPLAGTEGALSPFFSPDGKWMGFRRGATLTAVDLESGKRLTMMDSLPFHPRGFAWIDHRTVLTANTADGLYRFTLREDLRVAAVERITSVGDLGHLHHMRPHAIPGRRAALFEISLPDSVIAIGLIDLDNIDDDDGGVRVIQRRGQSPRYASGHVVYSFFNELWAIPVDVQRLEPIGPPFSLGLPINGRPEWKDFALTTDGRLVYVRPHSFEGRLVIVDRSGAQQTVSRAWETYQYPRFSRDGTRLLYNTQGAVPARGMWIHDLRSGGLTGFQRDRAATHPVWSDLGDSILFTASDPSLRGASLFKRAADGLGRERMVMGPNRTALDLSPDGRWVLYGDDATRSLRLRDFRTGADVVIDRGRMGPGAARLAPDVRHVARSAPTAGEEHVFVYSLPGPGPAVRVSTDWGYEPTWSQDGTELFYRDGQSLIALGIETEPEFRVATRDTLFADRWDRSAGYDVHPDGQQFIFVDTRQDSATVVVRELPLPSGS